VACVPRRVTAAQARPPDHYGESVPPSSAARRTSGARSLAEDLRGRSDAELSDLLAARPDLARPAPGDITTLAARANTRASTSRALDRLDLAHLHTLEAVCVAAPATETEIAVLLDEDPDSSVVAGLVEHLLALALVWRGPDGLHVARAAADAIGDPAGLGPEVPGTPRGEELRDALTGLDPQSGAILAALTWGPPTGVLSDDANAPAGSVVAAGHSLLQARVLHRTDSSHVVLPRQVGLFLRHGRLYSPGGLTPPCVADSAPHVEPDVADATAGGRAAELLVLAAELISLWGAAPPRVLRSGGLAVRDLRAAARHLEIDTSQAAWLAETLHAAGLLARGDTTGRGRDDTEVWMPTGEADDWLEADPEHGWLRLAKAWLLMPAAPSMVGASDTGRINALSTQTASPPARQRRRDVLDALASLPPGVAPGEDALVDLVRWHHPRRAQRASADAAAGSVDVVQREAEWAALIGRRALSVPGRHLLEAAETAEADAAAAMARLIPPAVDHVVVQADLTAIAPGRLAPAAQSLMRLVSDVESRGGATVHRITETSVRRALDTGWSADRLLTEIASVSRTGVPQPLEYLVRDVARRHGVARVGSAASYVRSDDEALLNRAAADRALGLLRFRRLAPTVLISPIPAATVVEVLREQEYAPLAEGVDGEVSLASSGHHRTTRRLPDPVQVTGVDPRVAGQIVASMRQGERVRVAHSHDDQEGPIRTADPVVTAAVLREASADARPVWVGYVDEVGSVRRLLIRPHHVEAGRVLATVGEADQPRTLMLHRVTGARPVE